MPNKPTKLIQSTVLILALMITTYVDASQVSFQDSASPEFRQAVTAAYDSLPTGIVRMLIRGGIKIKAGGTIKELCLDKEAKCETGRGLQGPDSPKGLYYNKTILIPEYSTLNGSIMYTKVSTGELSSILYHEVGHAVDEILNISSDSNYRTLFDKEREACLNSSEIELGCFVLPQENYQEGAAELIKIACMGDRSPKKSLKLSWRFPNSFKFLRDRVIRQLAIERADGH